eukprot:jgi/Chrzof1/14500/Cz09g05050.t1
MDDDGDDLHFLNDAWSWYFHDPWSPDWTMQSYVKLGDVSTVEESALVSDAVAPSLHNGIWFCFRGDIFPCWDDVANINGGCLSIKILKHDARAYWHTLCTRMLAEALLKPAHLEDHWQLVNGLSISPKKHFCLIKIWVQSDAIGDRGCFDLGVEYDGDIWYKSNRDNITNNNTHSKGS